MRSSLVLVLIGSLCLVEARLLRQNPMTFTDVQGQQPGGVWSATGHGAEAGAASGAKGVRYNDGLIELAGDGTPGPVAQGFAGDRNTRSGNTLAESVTNLGHEVIAATSEGARAAAGSGVSDTLEEPGYHVKRASTGTSRIFTAKHINNRGSHAFTDNAGTSSATTGQGNGPTALAFGAEIASFSRSHRNTGLDGVGGPRDGFN